MYTLSMICADLLPVAVLVVGVVGLAVENWLKG